MSRVAAYIAELRKRRVIGGIFSWGNDLVGCTEAEIAEIAARYDHPLPLEYAEFLRLAGVKFGKFMVGTDVFYPRIIEVKTWAMELLAENEVPLDAYPGDAIPVAMHQGYQFHFIRPEGDDPPVHFYLEGQGFSVAAEHFSDFIANWVGWESEIIAANGR